jgi:hypothetical protein
MAALAKTYGTRHRRLALGRGASRDADVADCSAPFRCWGRCSISASRRAAAVETVNRAGFARTDGVHFSDIHGPGYRGVFDLANLDDSRFIIATGESGNPLSPHYGDMAQALA